MSGSVIHIKNVKGLSEEDIPLLRQRFGKNSFQRESSRRLLHMVADMILEPMFILLLFSCTLYFILGQTSEGLLMLVAMVFVAVISVYQEARSTKALNALKEYTEPKVTVIRGGKEKLINSDELLPGDVMILEEGNKVPADATILQENDLTVNESLVTGESFPVEKHETAGNNILYQGTLINSGKCYAQVTATGNETVLGKLGKAVTTYTPAKTLLQQQIRKYVKTLTLFGLSAFIIIWALNYLQSGLLADSLLLGLTLAMAAIPEEIPVAFSSFMALGAYHMAKLGIISRQPQTIENLGAVSVICLDKTGTITENKMEVKTIYDYNSDSLIVLEETGLLQHNDVLHYGVLASEREPFDAMEKAIHEAYRQHVQNNTAGSMKLVYEYNLQGRPPMMTHVYQNDGMFTVAAKGAAEKIISICSPGAATTVKINNHIKTLAAKGYRVIGVASAKYTGPGMPAKQESFNWKFEGLLALYDPPKKNIAAVFNRLYDARINIKLLTGDYPETVITIAEQVGMKGYHTYVTGEKIMAMDAGELSTTVKTVNIFARMFPDAKLKVIEALKAGGEIVAMTGDGVNDGPALKSADIGIAMGQKGTEIARRAADLVLTDDNLEKVVEAIRQGRKIFTNLKKAVRYIISIHIPIILTASLPLLLGWQYPTIFTPIHVIFLELIMGPTCSVFFEREPVEEKAMWMPPRNRTTGLFGTDELLTSMVQGIIITGGVLILYYVFMNNRYTLEETRAVVFTTLVFSNIFLTFANRSFTENISKTIRYKNNLAPWIVVISVFLLSAIHFVPFIRNLFGFSPIGFGEIGLCAGVAFACVMWIELYKTHLKEIR